MHAAPIIILRRHPPILHHRLPHRRVMLILNVRAVVRVCLVEGFGLLSHAVLHHPVLLFLRLEILAIECLVDAEVSIVE